MSELIDATRETDKNIKKYEKIMEKDIKIIPKLFNNLVNHDFNVLDIEVLSRKDRTYAVAVYDFNVFQVFYVSFNNNNNCFNMQPISELATDKRFKSVVYNFIDKYVPQKNNFNKLEFKKLNWKNICCSMEVGYINFNTGMAALKTHYRMFDYAESWNKQDERKFLENVKNNKLDIGIYSSPNSIVHQNIPTNKQTKSYSSATRDPIASNKQVVNDNPNNRNIDKQR